MFLNEWNEVINRFFDERVLNAFVRLFWVVVNAIRSVIEAALGVIKSF